MLPFIDDALIELTDAVAPPLIDVEQLDRLVAADELVHPSEGECTEHEGCRPIFERRLA
jgi:hypothetical protein